MNKLYPLGVDKTFLPLVSVSPNSISVITPDNAGLKDNMVVSFVVKAYYSIDGEPGFWTESTGLNGKIGNVADIRDESKVLTLRIDLSEPSFNACTMVGTRINVLQGDIVTINGNISEPVSIIVKLTDQDGNYVNTVKLLNIPSDNFIVTWNGTDNSGYYVNSGKYNINIRAEDLAGNLSVTSCNFPIEIEYSEIAPESRITVNGDSYVSDNTWILSPSASMILTANVVRAPVKQIEYSFVEDGSWQVYTSPVILPTSGGIYTLYYRAIDTVGIVEKTKQQQLFVDAVPPVNPQNVGMITLNMPVATVSWNVVTDNDCDGYKLYVNDSLYKVITPSTLTICTINVASYNVSPIIKITAFDRFNNESGYSEEVKLGYDDIPPHTEISFSGVQFYERPLRITPETLIQLTAKDNYSGIKRIEWTANTSWNVYTSPVTLSIANLVTLSYRAIDNNDNIEPTKTIVLKIADYKPTTILGLQGNYAEKDGVLYVNSSMVFNLSATDCGISPNYLNWSLDGENWNTSLEGVTQVTFPTSINGLVTLSYVANYVNGYTELTKNIKVYIDNTPPIMPTGIKLTQVKRNGVSLAWDKNLESDCDGYNVYMNDVLVQFVTNNQAEIHFSSNDQQVAIRIAAVDLLGNESKKSDEFLIDFSQIPLFDKTFITDFADYKKVFVKYHTFRGTKQHYMQIMLNNTVAEEINSENWRVRYPLSPGMNKIQLSAVSANGYQSDPTIMYVELNKSGWLNVYADALPAQIAEISIIDRADEYASTANIKQISNSELKRIPMTHKECLAKDISGNIINDNALFVGTDVYLEIPYDVRNLPAGMKEDDLRVFVLNELSMTWEIVSGRQIVDKANHTVQVKVNHFSHYALFGVTSLFSTSLKELIVYPNPYRPNDDRTDNGDDVSRFIVFDGLTEASVIKIFTISGEPVLTLHPKGSREIWKADNTRGEKLASGVYVYVITNNKKEIRKGRITIDRSN